MYICLYIILAYHLYSSEVTIPHALINTVDSRGNSHLILATKSGNTQTVKQLLTRGANPNFQRQSDDDFKYWTALMFAVKADYPNIVELLLASKAQINLKDSQGQTALLLAIPSGNITTIMKLILAKANLNVQRQSDGWTALMLAIKEGHENIAKLLIRKGANLEMQNYSMPSSDVDQGCVTALTIALREKRWELAQFLVEKGANFLIENTCYFSTNIHPLNPLILANQNNQVLSHLMMQKLSKQHPTQAFMWAARLGLQLPVIQLLEKGVNINYKDKEGNTALMWATMSALTQVEKQKAMVNLLLQKGANPELKNKKGQTAKTLALKEDIFMMFPQKKKGKKK